MSWKEIEHIFNRSLRYSLSKKKFLFVFPLLVLCGLLIVLCRALALGAGDWVVMSLTFLPVFLSSSVLLSAGILLIRLYHNEVKQLPVSLRKTLRDSWDLMVGIAYLSLPLVLAYLLLWTVLGFFYLLKAIPKIGMMVGVILSFGPFLLVLGSLLLSIFSLVLLFLVTPEVALKSVMRLKTAENILKRASSNISSHFILFVLGLIPTFVLVGLLSLAAVLTGTVYLEPTHSLSIILQWFFIMLPFCAILSPAVIFFFNFAAESHVLMQRKLSSS